MSEWTDVAGSVGTVAAVVVAIGNMPPAEAEARYYAQLEAPELAA